MNAQEFTTVARAIAAAVETFGDWGSLAEASRAEFLDEWREIRRHCRAVLQLKAVPGVDPAALAQTQAAARRAVELAMIHAED